MNAKELETKYTYRQLRKMYQTAAQQARAAYKAVTAAYPGSTPAKLYKGDFKSFTTISKKGMKKADLAKQLASTQRYLESRFSSVKGFKDYKEDSIDTFHKHNYNFVNSRNFNEVQEWMKDMTDKGLKDIYGSDQVLTAFNRVKKHKLTDEQLAENVALWIEQGEKLKEEHKKGKLIVRSRSLPSSSGYFEQ